PKEEAGRTLGTLQMGTVSGGLFGPVIGGLLADNVGFSYTFIFTSIAIAVAATVVLAGINEERSKEQRDQRNKYSSKQV
ncbi:MFS transporter, partial [Micrococcus sp. SIMBA_144]